MSDDLVKRLRHEQHLCVITGDHVTAEFMREIADAFEDMGAENKRLWIAAGDARKKSETAYLRAVESRTAWRARAEQAERKLQLAQAGLGVADTNHRQMSKQLADLGRALAEAVEVLKPFAEFDHATASDQPSACVIARGRTPSVLKLDQFEAARQFVKEHGKP